MQELLANKRADVREHTYKECFTPTNILARFQKTAGIQYHFEG